MDNTIIEKARNADLISFLEKHYGYTFTYRNNTYRCKQHQSLAVKNDRLSFYRHSRGIGGHGALDYLMKIDNIPFLEAVEIITGTSPKPVQPMPEIQIQKKLILPDKASIPLRLYDYLCNKRGIDGVIVKALIAEGKLFQDMKGNIIFVGFDEHGTARFASIRGTYGNNDLRYDCSGSDKRYGFNMTYTRNNQLYIYESPIDAMSQATMENLFKKDETAFMRNNRLSLAGITDTAMPIYLKQHPFIEELIFCLDNDPPGKDASNIISKKYYDKGYYIRIEQSLGKDYNEDLINFIEKSKLKKSLKNTVKLHKNISI